MNDDFIKHFNISEEILKETQSEGSNRLSPLEILFETNKINSENYLSWAKDYYGLPSIKEGFIKDDTQIKNLLNRYKNIFPKNIIPFYEWDGTLYLLCLEPIAFNAPQSIQFILSPYELIKKYSHENETSIPSLSNIARPSTKEETNILFKDLNEQAEAPANFDFQIPDNILPNNLSPNAPATPENVPSSEASSESKETHIIQLENAHLANNKSPTGLDFPSHPDQQGQEKTNSSILAEDILKVAPPTNEAPSSSLPLETTLEGNSSPEESPEGLSFSSESLVTTIKDLNKEDPMKEVASISVTPSRKVSSIKEASSPKGSEGSLFERILGSMDKYFSQSMILQYKDNLLVPLSWKGEWSLPKDIKRPFNLSTPSIFRIVNDTKSPYHGYVIPSPTNDQFFKDWNNGRYPEHITLFPILDEGKITGMILGITSKDGSTKFKLHHIEEIANNSISILKNSKKAA